MRRVWVANVRSNLAVPDKNVTTLLKIAKQTHGKFGAVEKCRFGAHREQFICGLHRIDVVSVHFFEIQPILLSSLWLCGCLSDSQAAYKVRIFILCVQCEPFVSVWQWTIIIIIMIIMLKMKQHEKMTLAFKVMTKKRWVFWTQWFEGRYIICIYREIASNSPFKMRYIGHIRKQSELKLLLHLISLCVSLRLNTVFL